jgi:hypothetical protein
LFTGFRRFVYRKQGLFTGFGRCVYWKTIPVFWKTDFSLPEKNGFGIWLYTAILAGKWPVYGWYMGGKCPVYTRYMAVNGVWVLVYGL